MVIKPTINITEWASAESVGGGSVTEPVGRKTTGFQKSGGIVDKQRFQESNFLFKSISEWLTYFEEVTDEFLGLFFQLKLLTADVTTNGVMSDLTFTLTAGKTYVISGSMFLRTGTTDNQVDVTILDGANVIDFLINADADTSNEEGQSKAFSHLYQMVGTSLTFVAGSTDALSQIDGNNTRNESFVTVQEVIGLTPGTVT